MQGGNKKEVFSHLGVSCFLVDGCNVLVCCLMKIRCAISNYFFIVYIAFFCTHTQQKVSLRSATYTNLVEVSNSDINLQMNLLSASANQIRVKY
jgi:hypothetical protein